MKLKIKGALKKLPKKEPTVAVEVEPTPKPVVMTIRIYRIQTQRVDTKYAHIWYDLEQGGDPFETERLQVAAQIRDALRKVDKTKMRYRIIQIMEVDL